VEDVTQLSFEEALAELDRLTGLLEKGQIPLAEALAAKRRGDALLDRAQALLDQYQGS